MATVARTWVFAAGLEGFTEVGDDAVLGVSWASTDGNPAGSIEWQTSSFNGSARSERARDTLEAWTSKFPGIPAGATITQVQVTGWDELSWNAHASSRQVRFRIVNSGGTTVHSAGELFDTGAGTPSNNAGTPVAKGAGTARAVDASYQDASTQVSFEIQLNATDDNSGNYDLEQDNIAVTVTYTPPVASQIWVPHRMPLGV